MRIGSESAARRIGIRRSVLKSHTRFKDFWRGLAVMLDGAKERPTNWGHKESLSLSHKLGT